MRSSPARNPTSLTTVSTTLRSRMACKVAARYMAPVSM